MKSSISLRLPLFNWINTSLRALHIIIPKINEFSIENINEFNRLKLKICRAPVKINVRPVKNKNQLVLVYRDPRGRGEICFDSQFLIFFSISIANIIPLIKDKVKLKTSKMNGSLNILNEIGLLDFLAIEKMKLLFKIKKE